MSQVGLGTFPFSNVFGRVTEDEAATIVHAYLDGGGSYIQTAPYYEGVDDLVGRILSDIPRDRYVLGTLSVKARDSSIAGSRDAIFRQIEDSLSRLGCDYVDYYMTSTPRGSDVPLAESIAAMNELRSSGLVRHVGVCNVTFAELQEYEQGGSVEVVQNRMSLVDQDQDREVREYAVARGISLIPYNVIEWGLLTSRILESFELRDGDIRRAVLPVFRPEAVDVLRSWVLDHVVPLATARGTTVEAVAIAWAISRPGVAFAPVGATRRTQIESSLAANELRDDATLMAELDAAYDVLSTTIREKHGQSVNELLRNSFGRW